MKTFIKTTAFFILLTFVFILFAQVGFGQIWTEDFTSGTYIVTLGGEGNDGNADYFQTTDGSNIGISYTGNTGNFFAAQDVDDGGWTGSANPSQLTWTGINISGYTNLEFSGLFASAAPDKIDDNDYVLIEYQIDGGGWNNLLAFENDGTQYNTEFGEDTDFDGDSDGADLSAAFSSFTKSILSTGSSLDLRITVSVNAGGEDFAFDTFQITGTSSNDNNSQVSTSSTLSEPATISSLTTSSNGVQVFDFTFTDAGSGDGVATIIDQLQITQGSANGVADWTNAIAGAVLNGPDVTNSAGTVNATNITFSGSGIISIADNTHETYTLSIWLKTDLSAVNDNDVLEFATDYQNITTQSSGSSFGSGAPESGDTNIAIDIDATELRFAQQPTDANINNCMSPDVSVEATDVNGNRDLDFTESIRITSTGSMSSTPLDVAAVSGIAAFTGADCVNHTLTGTNLTLNAERTNTLDWDITSNTFNITDINACGLEEFSNGTTAPAGWTFTNIGGTYTTATNYGNNSPSLKMDATGDMIETAPVTSPSQLSFWIKGQTTDASSALLVEGWDGSWNTIENIVPLPSTGTTKTYNTGLSSYSKFRFTYTKSAGNLAFDDVDVTCGNCAEPTNDASALTFPSKSSTSIDLSWTSGNGGNRIVICREGAAVSFTPADNNTYAANSDYSSGTEVGTAGELNKVVYNGSSNTTTVTGLEPGTIYYFEIFEYGCSGGAEDYLTSGTPLEGNETTLPENVSNFTLTCITNTTATLTWDIPNGGFDGVLIAVRESTNTPSDPNCEGSTLNTPDTDFLAALVYCGNGTTSKYVYNATGTNVTITGLTSGADYVFKAFTYKGSNWTSGTQVSGNATVNPVTDVNSFISNHEIRVTWANPTTCYDEVMIVGKQGASPAASPSGDGSLYTADAAFGTAPSGNNLPAGEFCVYKGVTTFADITNLTNSLNYCFRIFVRKGTDWSTFEEVCDTPADITVFKPGDLLFVGYDTKTSDNGCGGAVATDVFYIMTMIDIKPGTSFGLFNASYEYGAAANERTDKFWSCTSTPGQYSPGRIEISWNGAANISAGSIIEVFLTSTGAASYFEVNGTDETANFSSAGSYCNIADADPDQMWIYQGTITDFGTTPNIYATINGNILYGLSNQASWVPFSSAVSTVRTSRVHPDIECFSMDFAGDVPVNYYNTGATHSGSKRVLLGSIMNSGNWSVVTNTVCNDVPPAVGTTIFTISSGYSAGTWRGDTNNDWFNCSNWEELIVPDKTMDIDIVLAATITNSPTIDKNSIYASRFGYYAECNNLTIDNETLTMEGSNQDTLFIHGNLTMQNSAVLDLDDGNTGTADGIVYLYGNYDNQVSPSDALQQGNSTFNFVGSNEQTINADVSETFYNLGINNLSLPGVQMLDNLTISGIFTHEDGTLDLNGHNLTMSGEYNRTQGNFEGSTASNFTISGSGNLDPIYFVDDLNVNEFVMGRDDEYANLMTNITTAGKMAISSDGTGGVIFNAGNEYTIGGWLSNSGTAGSNGVIIKSDASGTASLLQTNGSVEATCERYLDANQWHFLSIPLNAASTSQLNVVSWGVTNPNFYWYDETVADRWAGSEIYSPAGWTSESNGNLDPLKAYIHRSTESRTYELSGGNLQANDVNFTLKHTVNSDGGDPLIEDFTGTAWTEFDGWNMLVNPYACALDWDAVWTSFVSAGTDGYLENGIYYMDNDDYTSTNNEKGSYCYYTSGAAAGHDLGMLSTNGGSRYIPAHQAVFVKSTLAGNGQTITIPKSARLHSSQDFWKKSQNTLADNTIRLSIANDNYEDETIIRTLDIATYDHDYSIDAYKMFAWDTENPQILSRNNENSKYFGVNSIPNITSHTVIPLVTYIGTAGEYSIKNIENAFVNTHVWLEDRAENIFTKFNSANDVYTFSQTAETNYDRFYLHFDLNHKPLVNIEIPDQISDVNEYFSYSISENTFIDNDFEDVLTLSASLADGTALPEWLTFNATTNEFSGTPDEVQVLNIKLTAKDSFNETISDEFKLTVKSVSSIAKLSENSISIYPNPANDKITIELSKAVNSRILIIDIAGQVVYSAYAHSQKSEIDLSNLAKGIYFVDIIIKGQTVRKKIVLQ